MKLLLTEKCEVLTVLLLSLLVSAGYGQDMNSNHAGADTLYACDTLLPGDDTTDTEEWLADKSEDQENDGPPGMGLGTNFSYSSQGDWGMLKNVKFQRETRVVTKFGIPGWELVRDKQVHFKLDGLRAAPFVTCDIIGTSDWTDKKWWTFSDIPDSKIPEGVHDLYVVLDTLNLTTNPGEDGAGEDIYYLGIEDQVGNYIGGFGGPHGILFLPACGTNNVKHGIENTASSHHASLFSYSTSSKQLNLAFKNQGSFSVSLYRADGTLLLQRSDCSDKCSFSLPRAYGAYIVRVSNGVQQATRRVIITK